MIILHFHLQPQFIYELFHINFTSVLVNVQFSARVAGEISRASALICFGGEVERGLVPIG